MKFSMLIPVGHGATEEFQSAAAIAAMAGALEAANVDACFLTDHPAPSAEWLRADGHDALDPFTALYTTQQLAEKITTLRDLRASLGRSGSFDITIGPPARPEFGSRDSAERYLEEVRQFSEIGVTWVTTVPPSQSRQAYLELFSGLERKSLRATE